MAKCNTQANDMAKTANNWQTPGASNPGRYNTPPLTRDLVPRSQERDGRERGRGEVRTQEKKQRIESTREEEGNDENDEDQSSWKKTNSETTLVRTI